MKKNLNKSNSHKIDRRSFLSSSAMLGAGLVTSTIPGIAAVSEDQPESNQQGNPPVKEAVIQVWLVTGANRGNGRGIAEAAVKAGHKVVVTARKPSKVPKELAEHPNVLVAELDVTKQATINSAVSKAIEKFGRIDVLVNNAGYGQLGWFENTTEQQIRNQFETNVFGPMNVTRAILPFMRKQRSGNIFTVTSVAGILSVAGSTTYSASKFALEGWMEGLADELKPLGISVTAIEPGFFRTDFLDKSSAIYSAVTIEDYKERAVAFIEWHNKMNHHQVGDPARLGTAITEIAKWKEAPLRFVAGTAGMQGAITKLQGMITQIPQLKQLSSSTDGNWRDTMHA